MVVAVIDDGVNENRYSVGPLAYSVEIGENLSVRERTDYDRYAESHGLRIVERTKRIDSTHEVY